MENQNATGDVSAFQETTGEASYRGGLNSRKIVVTVLSQLRNDDFFLVPGEKKDFGRFLLHILHNFS